MTADTPADRPAGLAIEVVASLLSELADLRAEVERLTAEAREHVTELNLATINSFHAGEQSKEAELAALRQALAEITEGLARMEWCEWGCDENARAVLAASAREVTP